MDGLHGMLGCRGAVPKAGGSYDGLHGMLGCRGAVPKAGGPYDGLHGMLGCRGAVPKAGGPYDGLHGGWTNMGCHEDSRALDGAANREALNGAAGRGALNGTAGRGVGTEARRRAGMGSGGIGAGRDVGDGTGVVDGNVVGSTHRLFPGGALKILLVRGMGAAGRETNCTGVAGTASRGVSVLLVSGGLGVAGEWGGLMSQTNVCIL